MASLSLQSKTDRASRGIHWILALTALIVLSRGGVFHLANELSHAKGFKVEQISADTLISQPFLMPLYLAIYIAAAMLLVSKLRQATMALRKEKYIAATVLVALLSASWSVLTTNSFTKAVALCGSTAVGIYLAIKFSKEQQLRLMIQTTFLLMISSTGLALLFPETGRMQGHHSGLWQGMFLHKNELGRIMCIGAVCSYIAAVQNPKQGTAAIYWLVSAGCLFTMLMSSSKGAMLVFTFCIGLASATTLYYRRWHLLIALLSIALTTATLWMQVRHQVFLPHMADSVGSRTFETIKDQRPKPSMESTSLGPSSARDLPVDSRVRLWRQLIGFGMDRPLLGYGLGAFWQGRGGPSGDVLKQQTWYPFHAHNGFLELWPDLGLIGLLVFLPGLITAAIRCHSAFSAESPDLFYSLLLIQIVLFNLGTSDLVTGNHLFWVLYVTLALSLVCRPNSNYHVGQSRAGA